MRAPPAVAMGLGTRFEAQRNRRSIRPTQRFVAAGQTLRPAHHPMPRTCEGADIHRDRVIVYGGRLLQRQPFDDLRRDQPVQPFQHRRLSRERLEGGFLTGKVAEKTVDFPMVAQAVRQAVPAGSLSIRAKDWTEQRLHAARPHRHPRRRRFELAPVHVGEAWFEIIVAQDDGKPGIARPPRRRRSVPDALSTRRRRLRPRRAIPPAVARPSAAMHRATTSRRPGIGPSRDRRRRHSPWRRARPRPRERRRRHGRHRGSRQSRPPGGGRRAAAADRSRARRAAGY